MNKRSCLLPHHMRGMHHVYATKLPSYAVTYGLLTRCTKLQQVYNVLSSSYLQLALEVLFLTR